MPEEEKNEETQAEAPAEEAPEAPAEEAAPEEAPAEEAPQEEAPAAEEPAAEQPAAAEAPAAEVADDEAPLGPKERRRRARSAHTGEARPQRSPEERLADRAEQRRKKAEERRRWRARSRERRKAAPHDTTPQAPVEHEHARPRVRQGVVVSSKPDKTITVRIEVQRGHRTYGKIVRNSSTLHAHDEGNEANAGDTVRIVESRPLSRNKRWRLVEILERAR
jgi:small subunit ribosomal protein S17